MHKTGNEIQSAVLIQEVKCVLLLFVLFSANSLDGCGQREHFAKATEEHTNGLVR